MGQARWIKMDGSMRIEEINKFPSIEEITKHLEGQIRFIRIIYNNQQAWMLVNETGLISGLKINVTATEIYQAMLKKDEDSNHPIMSYKNNEKFIAGNILILIGIEIFQASTLIKNIDTVKVRATLADNLKRIRRSRGLSKHILSSICGFHQIYLGLIERAEVDVGIDALDRISKALKILPEELLQEGKSHAHTYKANR